MRQNNGDRVAVANHYNARPNIGISARNESPIIGLKNFNNWIKSVLVATFGRREGSSEPRIKVLDLGCGKGGDLQKWAKAGTDELVGIDLAEVSIEQARERWQSMRNRPNVASFHVCDCFETSIEQVLDNTTLSRPFDVVSMQFCMHYAFETKEKAHMMLSNVSRFLRPGGRFIGTIPDAENLLSRLDAIEDDNNLAFGNSVYGIKFDHRTWDSPFGHRYTFYLQDAVDEVPEYVVYWEEFVQMAENYGLELSYCKDFQQIFADEKDDSHFATLLKRMKVVNQRGETEMTVDQWEAASKLYNIEL
ncbi:mRNA cap guanine-N7 methyltransferase [Microbotryomycetes sp. JL221]|nr:mRNA cap guanine-N7 methyltransferase [Microbotryomycetes sp. JL221]